MPPRRLASVNLGRRRVVDYRGRPVETGIWKHQTAGKHAIGQHGLGADVQVDKHAHGGPDKALYAYGLDDYRWWEGELGQPTDPGLFGENLTVEGVDVTGAAIGDRWVIGTAILEVSEPRLPCFKLDLRMDEPRFSRRFSAAGRPGCYLRVIEPGVVQAGDQITVEPVDAPRMTVGDVAAIYDHDRHLAGQLLDVDGLSSSWHTWARRTLELRSHHGY